MNDHVNVSVPSLTNSKDLFQPQFFVLTHIGKLSGNDSGDFPETFSKKNILLYCDVTTDDN